MKNNLFKLFILILLSIPSFAFAATMNVDCDTGDDGLSTINGGETYKTIQRAVDVVLQNATSNSIQIISVKGGCGFGHLQFNAANFQGSNLIIQSSNNTMYSINAPANDWAIYGNGAPITNKIVLKNARISGSSQHGLFYIPNSGNNFQVTDSQIDVSRNIGYDNGNLNFEMKNSLINISQDSSINAAVRFPSYFHDNIIEDRGRGNKASWLYGFHASPAYLNRMGVLNNKFNIYYDLSDSGNHYFMKWFNAVGNVRAVFGNNEVNYLGAGSATFTYLFHEDTELSRSPRGAYCSMNGRTRAIVNTKWSGISKIDNFFQDDNNCAPTRVVANTTFDAGSTLPAVNAGIYFYNNINATAWNNTETRNKASNDNTGYRTVIDINNDGIIDSGDFTSDTYCSSSNCASNQFTLSW